MKLLSAIYRGIAIASLLVLVPACGPRYKKRSLQPLNTANSHFEATNNDITMRARVLTAQEALHTFNGRGKKLFTGKKPAHVIQIACANNSSEVCQINDADIQLKSISKEELFDELRFSGLQRALSIGLGGGLGLVGLSSLERLNYFALTSLNSPWIFWSSVVVLGTTISAGVLAIPALTVKHAIESKYYNKKIKHDITSKLGDELQLIDPHLQKDWLLVVKHKNFKPSFLIKVTDRYNNELTSFEVNLLQKNGFIWHATA
ncbi:MAG: hypothetical protein ACOYT8_01505 [Candidatus Dependentiae bacterium]